MRNNTGLTAYFWLSLFSALVAGFILPFHSGNPYAGLVIMLLVAPAIALSTLVTNIALIVRTPGEAFWKFMLACLLALSGFSALAIFGPSEADISARRRQKAFDEATESYLAALKKRDYAGAERVFIQATKANASDFPFEVACVVAEKAMSDGLAFTIALQRRLQDHLVARDEPPCRAISWAVEHGDMNVARIAVQNGEVFGQGALETTVTVDCCLVKKGLTEAQRIAFYQLAAQNRQVPRELIPSPLATAVRQKTLLLAGAIVKSAGGVDDLPDKGGEAMMAAASNDWESIETLLALGIDVNVVGENHAREKATALVKVLDSTNQDRTMLTKLLARGASIRPPDGRGLLVLALKRCNVADAAVLLEHGADPNSTDLTMRPLTPLRFALACIDDKRGGDSARDLAHSLLKRGAEPNPRYEAAWHQLADVCINEKSRTAFDLLMAAGADINARDKEGRTALMDDFGDKPKLTEKLLQCGIKVNARDHRGWTALQYMQQRQYGESMSVLCARNARPQELCKMLPPAARTEL